MSVGEGVEDLADGELAVAGADQSGLDRVDAAGAAQAALLAQHDGLGVLRAGFAGGLLHDVDAQGEPVVLADRAWRRRAAQSRMAGAIGCSTAYGQSR